MTFSLRLRTLEVFWTGISETFKHNGMVRISTKSSFKTYHYYQYQDQCRLRAYRRKACSKVHFAEKEEQVLQEALRLLHVKYS
jgi:hypothetical protein